MVVKAAFSDEDGESARQHCTKPKLVMAASSGNVPSVHHLRVGLGASAQPWQHCRCMLLQVVSELQP